MDKNAIKKYAVWARRELISRVSQKALQYGITEKHIVPADDESVNGHLLTAAEKKQRQALITQVNEKGYKQVMEEVAYTWFNRFSALRFMEVNGYLPSHVRVFTDEENNFKPQILTEAIHLELDGLDMDKVYAFKETNQTEELYKYLLITQCNALNAILPGMFQKIEDYTELLFPDNLLRDGSVVEQMIALISEDDWKDAVQIIGWLYQYYNTEPKDKVFADLKKNIKITKDNIPAATQLFTPDWIVRYMVENSLGRLWLERDKAESELSGEYKNASYYGWKYYLEEAEQEPEVQEQLAAIREEYKTLKPEDIRCIDPCMGSGHILAYMFDVLVQIYEAYGYTTREAVASIVENNIYGLDIDERAAQLAYFAVMMKARQYDRRFFSRGIQPRVYAIVESNHISSHYVDYFCNNDANLKSAVDTIMQEMHDAREYGSIISVFQQDFVTLYARFDKIQEDVNILCDETLRELLPLVQVAETLAQKYDVVVTNPPYIGGRNMNTQLLNKIAKDFTPGKADLYSAFIICCMDMAKRDRYVSMITQHSWMFLSSFDRLREFVLESNIVIMNHLGARAFEEISGEVVQTATWVTRKSHLTEYKGSYVRLVDYDSQLSKEEAYLHNEAPTYNVSQTQFGNIPGKAFAYWLGNPDIFTKGELLESVANPRQGMKTLDNDYYIKFWFEINRTTMCIIANTAQEAIDSNCKWFPINHGGEFRKYYGNNYSVVNWLDDGAEMKANAIKKYNCITRTITNIAYYFKPGITWSVICSYPSFRWFDNGFLFSNGGQCIVPDNTEDLIYLSGLMNSKVTNYLLNILSPTLGFESGYMKKIPVIKDASAVKKIEKTAENNIQFCKEDWDSFEISWDFKCHPLITSKINLEADPTMYTDDLADGVVVTEWEKESSLAKTFDAWERHCDQRFNHFKANEEELNRIFINIYGLQDELTPEVEDNDLTVRKADLARDIKSFMSYAVGCMFGRYSLDVEGLVYAGGEWDANKYTSFPVDKDNIIPICDDEYFEDDIAGRFVKFVEVVYGKEMLRENLQFIADALGGKGQPKDVIRNYFINDFYNDHCKIYQKRPIYWLFDSGKKNGFKALIYMHRYQPDTIARMRTDYVHEQQARYRTTIADLEQRINGASTSERVKLNKLLIKLQEQAVEILIYEEKVHHLADQMIFIDLDDGVKHNYEIFKDILAKIK